MRKRDVKSKADLEEYVAQELRKRFKKALDDQEKSIHDAICKPAGIFNASFYGSILNHFDANSK